VIRMPGGVGGAAPRGVPLSRSPAPIETFNTRYRGVGFWRDFDLVGVRVCVVDSVSLLILRSLCGGTRTLKKIGTDLNAAQSLRWTRSMRPFGGLAKVDQGCFYAANCSVISAIA
jgi:hypothetical protein